MDLIGFTMTLLSLDPFILGTLPAYEKTLHELEQPLEPGLQQPPPLLPLRPRQRPDPLAEARGPPVPQAHRDQDRLVVRVEAGPGGPGAPAGNVAGGQAQVGRGAGAPGGGPDEGGDVGRVEELDAPRADEPLDGPAHLVGAAVAPPGRSIDKIVEGLESSGLFWQVVQFDT